MEGERRKRKMEMEGDGEEREDEEEKMEKFYGLIRNIRDVRERMMRSAENKSKGGEKGEKGDVEIWNPKFQPEDFMDGADRSVGPQPTLALPAPSTTQSQTKDTDKIKTVDEGDHLDLNLSL